MLGEEHTSKISQLHRLLLELIPVEAKLYLSARQALPLLATARPRDAAGKARKHVAPELVADLEKVYTRSKAADKDLTAALKQTGTHSDGPERHRSQRRRDAAGRGRRHHPVPGPEPLRLLDRHRS